MAEYSKKYIITGAPGTGKTTLIKDLEKEFPCMHEVSRKVILKEQENGGDAMPWQDLEKFVALVYDAFIIKLDLNPKALFTDRSILDLIAYLRLDGKTIPQQLDTFPYLDKFHRKVFFAPVWEAIYQKDSQRLQDFDHCVALEKALVNIYREKGFEVVRLPEDTVGKRIRFIYENLNQV
ncbi:AAA family ATPase [Ulvibacterium sp.]|uniref:AAA family ATPase n=1 Tax=Ulvibacterium sp. TaxID=2665914 RepID=UPI0026184B42|nr:AAA family ATPase [Ulvibacterium sp.]